MVGLPGVSGTADERAFLEGAGAMEKWPSLPEMSPEAGRGRSTLISPFLSPPIFSQCLPLADPNQNAIGQEVWKPQFEKLSLL